MKRLLQTNHRPVVWVSLYFILGIIGGSIWEVYPYTTFLLYLLISILPIVGLIVCTRDKKWLLLSMSFLLAYVMYFNHPVERDHTFLQEQCRVIGEVVEETQGSFQTVLVLDKVKVVYKGQVKRLDSKVQLLTETKCEYKVGDVLKVTGRIKPPAAPMNPSDMNYPLYLKGQGISQQIKVQTAEKIGHHISFIPAIKEQLNQQISKVFVKDRYKIIPKLLIGEEDTFDQSIEDTYYALGIGHILAISGLHVGVIFGLGWWVLGKIGTPYKWRILVNLLSVWGYAALVGMSVSAVRACLILTIVYIGRMLWEEEDLLISVAIAAVVILVRNPYQLFQVGFQLSFVAYITILGMNEGIKFCRIHHYRKRQYVLMLISPILLNVMIMPILAWHFYEVPLFGTLLNFVVVPLFSMLIPACLLILLLSTIALEIAILLGGAVSMLLEGITHIARFVETLPYATFVTGRPTVLEMIVFYMIVVVGIIWFISWCYKYYVIASCFMLVGMQTYRQINASDTLEVTHLYVGQGDSTIITTPSKEVILIDGGSVGKEKTIERYIKYKGYDKINYAIVSHPHEDHVGGVIGLIEKGISMDYLMTKPIEEDEWSKRLRESCKINGIKYKEIQGNEQLTVGDVSLDFMLTQKRQQDTNNYSVLCLLTYGYYTELFTGDISEKVEIELMDSLEAVTVLKVAHHGSKTSTTKKFLEQINPKYGMISCGINNRYGHPNTQIIERLEEMEVTPLQTNKRGAIRFITNGNTLSIASQIQED